jgi:hypothetical protein
VIAEALDTVVTLGWALAAWIVALAAAVTLAGYALGVAVWWPCRTAREALDAAVAASRALTALREPRLAHNAADGHQAPRATADTPHAATDGPHSAPQPPDAPDTHHTAPKPYSARTDRPSPTWAQPDSEEAA